MAEPPPGKYARVERERRFLLAGLPRDRAPVRVHAIVDRYLTGTRLRLREMTEAGAGRSQYKLGQKIPADTPGAAQGLITNIYLAKGEYDLLAQLPARVLTKTRHSLPPLGVDVFDPPLHGLVLAEAEFASEQRARAFRPPAYVIAEVTGDPRFTGGSLAGASRDQLLAWLAEYGLGRGWRLPDADGR
jgi:CYTH domain-containing protein